MRKLIIAVGIIAAILAVVISLRAKGQMQIIFGDIVIYSLGVDQSKSSNQHINKSYIARGN